MKSPRNLPSKRKKLLAILEASSSNFMISGTGCASHRVSRGESLHIFVNLLDTRAETTMPIVQSGRL
jgi:hypothetical protein